MKLKKYVPRSIRKLCGLVWRAFGLLGESFQDAWRYFRSSAISGNRYGNGQAHLESDIIRLYHVAEKSLSMPEFKPRSAREVVVSLHQSLQRWEGPMDCQIRSGWSVLEAYRAKHEELGIDITDILPQDFAVPSETAGERGGTGGVKIYNPQNPDDLATFLRVMTSRVSVRNFDPERIPEPELLERAVSAAMSAPSVCNRQTWKAHCFQGDLARKVLSFQNGNRGFGHTIPTVFVVTSDLRFFLGASERYQGWIDGGMFAMCLLYGLQAQGLGAVALNWSVLNKRDKELRQAASLPKHERVIMLIGCGHPAEGATVPVSTRRGLDEVLVRHP